MSSTTHASCKKIPKQQAAKPAKAAAEWIRKKKPLIGANNIPNNRTPRRVLTIRARIQNRLQFILQISWEELRRRRRFHRARLREGETRVSIAVGHRASRGKRGLGKNGRRYRSARSRPRCARVDLSRRDFPRRRVILAADPFDKLPPSPNFGVASRADSAAGYAPCYFLPARA